MLSRILGRYKHGGVEPDYEGIHEMHFNPSTGDLKMWYITEDAREKELKLKVNSISSPEDETVDVIVLVNKTLTIIRPPKDGFFFGWMDSSTNTFVFWNDPVRLIL